MLEKRVLLVIFLSLLWPVVASSQGIQRADSLASMGSEYLEQGNFREAEPYFAEALELYRQYPLEDTTRYVDLSIDYSDVLYERARYEEAIKQLDNIKPLVIEQQDTTRIIKEMIYRGLIQKNQNRFRDAREQYKQAIKVATKVHDSVQVAILYDNMGDVSRQLGEYMQSLNYRQTALDLFEKVGTDMNIAICLNNIGLTYIQRSMYDRAYEYIVRSLSLSKNLGNSSRLMVGYGNLGMVQYHLGNYDQAIIAYQKALEYARQTGNPVKQAHILTNLGNVYNKLGDSGKSLDYYLESLGLLKEHNISTPSELSTKYTNIAMRQLGLGKEVESEKNFIKALNLRKQVGNKREIAQSYLDIAYLEKNKEEFANALSYAERSRQIADSMQVRNLMLKSRISLGGIQRAMHNTRQALRHYKKAYKLSLQFPSGKQIQPLKLLSYTFDDLQSDSSVFYGKKLINLIESNRSKIGELSILKTNYFEGYSAFYKDLASWMLKYEKDTYKAFELVEASKARALLDELVKASSNIDNQLPDSLRLKKQQMVETLSTIESRIDTTNDPEAANQLQRKLRHAELDYAAFMNQVRDQNPGYKDLELPSPVSALEARSLVDEETAVLEYAFAEDELLIFVVTSQGIHVRSMEILEEKQDKKRMTTLVEQFRDRILSHAPLEQIRTESQRLAETLIQPVIEELSGFSNLMIIPDGVLAYLPFEALSIEDQYLIEKFSIKYAPSLTTISLLKGRRQHTHSREMLAVAGSNFGGVSSQLKRKVSYSPLPATLAEVDSIATKFPGAMVIKKGNVSESFIKDNLTRNYRFVHLATHGIIDEEHPNLSGLALSQPSGEGTDKEDGMLRSSEIYQLSINSDMVVLSACNTGLGKIVNGEGILGLQRSFFYAGVPTVSVSLWNVYDRSTAFFMDQFYSALLKQLDSNTSPWQWKSLLRWVGWDDSLPFGSAAPAMRKAKLQLLEHPLFNHPVYWAPFIVVGR